MRNLCIIPARGGSKRIPRKNIKDFLGKPIIAYTIEQAMKSELFSEVMVSTDDEEIKKVAQQYGAKVPFMRSDISSDDYATTMDVLKEVLLEYEKTGDFFDYVCCFYPCSPLTTQEKLQECFNLIIDNNYDSVFPVIPFSYPVHRAVRLQKGKLSFFNPENMHTRSQDLEILYHDAGQFYWVKKEIILNSHAIVTSNTGAIEIKELEAQDIDNISDWKLAELKYKLMKENY